VPAFLTVTGMAVEQQADAFMMR
jgi:hypothetical protein